MNVNNDLKVRLDELLLDIGAKNKIISELQTLTLEKISNQQQYDILKEENSWLLKQLALRENKLKK